jgi:hypothetical protein
MSYHYTSKRDARAKAGDTIMIDGFAADLDGSIPESERRLIGKTGVVTFVGGMGDLHGTWGGIGILPNDQYHVIEEA